MNGCGDTTLQEFLIRKNSCRQVRSVLQSYRQYGLEPYCDIYSAKYLSIKAIVSASLDFGALSSTSFPVLSTDGITEKVIQQLDTNNQLATG